MGEGDAQARVGQLLCTRAVPVVCVVLGARGEGGRRMRRHVRAGHADVPLLTMKLPPTGTKWKTCSSQHHHHGSAETATGRAGMLARVRWACTGCVARISLACENLSGLLSPSGCEQNSPFGRYVGTSTALSSVHCTHIQQGACMHCCLRRRDRLAFPDHCMERDRGFAASRPIARTRMCPVTKMRAPPETDG